MEEGCGEEFGGRGIVRAGCGSGGELRVEGWEFLQGPSNGISWKRAKSLHVFIK